MSSRGPYRRHTSQFKLQLCRQIRSGAIGRRDAQKKHSLSTNLVQLWLTQYDRGEIDSAEAEASVLADHEAKIAALERKVGQLTMQLDLLKKTPRLRLVSSSDSMSIISGPTAAPSDGGAKLLICPAALSTTGNRCLRALSAICA